jgi:regulator of protease activity HflC (stomatin/prohibitin superfamily)
MEDNELKLVKWGAFVIIGVVLFLIFNPVSIINAGQRGVVLQFGKVVRIMDEGLNFRTPLIEGVVSMDVKTQKHEAKANSASSDLQTVNATVAVNYSINPTMVGDIYKTIGRDFEKVVIDPAIQEAIKASTAQFTAEELITKREAVRDMMEKHIIDRLSKRGFVVEAVNIVNFEFAESFDKAIEAKVVAEQDALASKNKLERIKYEAEQQVVSAKAQAETIKIQAEAVNAAGGSDYVKLQWIKAWEAGGAKVPVYITGDKANGFIMNIGQ